MSRSRPGGSTATSSRTVSSGGSGASGGATSVTAGSAASSAARREGCGVVGRQAPELLEVLQRVGDSTEALGEVGGQPETLGEALLAAAGERALDLQERGARPIAGELEASELEADERLGRPQHAAAPR